MGKFISLLFLACLFFHASYAERYCLLNITDQPMRIKNLENGGYDVSEPIFNDAGGVCGLKGVDVRVIEPRKGIILETTYAYNGSDSDPVVELEAESGTGVVATLSLGNEQVRDQGLYRISQDFSSDRQESLNKSDADLLPYLEKARIVVGIEKVQ